jgi:hypothetical protein
MLGFRTRMQVHAFLKAHNEALARGYRLTANL